MDYEVYLVRQGGRSSRGGSRLLRILEHGISVVALAVNNVAAAEYSFEHIAKVTACHDDATELSLEVLDTTKQGHGYHTLRFCCDSRSALLTVLLNRIDEVNGIGTDFLLKKHSNQRGGLTDTVLRVRSASIVKMVNIGHRQERRRMTGAKRINFENIVKLETLSDDEHIVLVYLSSRVMRLSLKDSLPFLLAVQRNMKSNLKQEIDITKITTSVMVENVATYLRKAKESPVLYQFDVTKRQEATKQERQRILCITKDCFIEKWVDNVIGVHSLKDILGLIVSERDIREVTLEFRSWRATHYFLEERDDFVASMAGLMGNAKGTVFSIRLEPYFTHTLPEKLSAAHQNECEAYFLNRFIGTYNSIRDPAAVHLALKEYACNIHVGNSQCNDTKVLQAVTETLKECVGGLGQDPIRATTCCIVLQRLLASRPCFEAIKSMPDVVAVLFQCMQSENSVLSYLATTVLRAAIKLAAEPGSVEIGSATKQEFANRLTALSADYLQQLVALLHTHSLAKNSALQVVGLLDTFTLALTSQPSDNEAGRMWFKAYEASIMTAADVLCAICRSPSAAVFNSNSVLLRALLTKTSPLVYGHLQKVCLGRCVVLVHLKTAIFSKREHVRMLSGNLVFLMMEGTRDARKLLEALLPRGVMQLYASKVDHLRLAKKVKLIACQGFSRPMSSSQLQSAAEQVIETSRGCAVDCYYSVRASSDEHDFLVQVAVCRETQVEVLQEKVFGNFPAWMETLEMLRSQTLETPMLVWNDVKRMELKKFLQDEVDGFYGASADDRELLYNNADVQLVYSTASEGEGSVIGGVHLELLVDHSPPAKLSNNSFWKLHEPLSIFQSVFQAMVLGFTPLFGHNNLPELDLRLAVHVLTWIYERHAEEVVFCLETLNVVETAVGMLREVVESEHQVFVFKLVVFLLATVEKGGRDNVLRFIRSGGATVLVPLVVLSLAKCGTDKHDFESVAWSANENKAQGAVETVQFVGSNGETRLIRIPSGRAHELLEKAAQDGSMDAKDAIKWQDERVPEKIQLGLAIDLLEALLRISGSNSNMEHFPPSAACFSFSREEIFCHLVQALLLAKTPIFIRILEIVTTLATANKTAMSHLYKLGAFEILLWKLLAGDIVDWDKIRISKFLAQSHLLQDLTSLVSSNEIGPCEPGSWRDSALHLYLPEGLILKLITEGPESFMALLDSQQDAPEVIWNTEMRQRLLDHLTGELASYVKFRATDPLALYIHVPKPPLTYPELAESVFSAPFYLHNLLDHERFPNYQINDPVGFLNSLMQDLRRSARILVNCDAGTPSWRRELPRTHLLLHAQAHLVDRFPKLQLPGDAETVLITLATPSLRTCLAEKDEAPPVATDILHYTVQILRRYCAAVTRDDEIPQASVNLALSILSLGTRLNTDGGFPEASSNIKLESAVTGSLFMLEIASSSRVGRQILRDDTRWQDGSWWALCCAAGDALAYPPRGTSPASFAALSSLKHFAEDKEFYDLVIQQALYLPLLLLAIPAANTALKAQDTKSALLYSAADVLGSVVRMLEQSSNQSERIMLTHLVPAPLLACLEHTEGPDKFMTMAGSDLEQPLVIWNSKVREELHRRVVERLQQHHNLLATGSGEVGSEVEWLQSFYYECLKDEIVIGSVFVNALATGQWEVFGLPTGHEFLDGLLGYLEDNRHALLSGPEANEIKNVGVDEYLTVLSALKETLRYALKLGRPELIARVQPTLLSSIALRGQSRSQVQVEIASIVEVLAQDESGRNAVLKSELMGSLAVDLWESAANPQDEGMETILMVTLNALRTLSERILATVEATNVFASSGVLLPLLAIFCSVSLPRLNSNEVGCADSQLVPVAGRIIAAQILGQLLLAGSGVSRRTKLLEDLAQRKRLANGSTKGSANGHSNYVEGIGEATDMYELINVLEPSRKDSHGADPMVIQTLLLLLPVDLLSIVARDPVEACKRFEGNYQSPRFVWDDGKRLRVKQTLSREAVKLQEQVKNQGLSRLSGWSLETGQAVFIRWIIITILYGETKATYRDNEQDGYALEMYLGGFFVDQFLRDPGYDFGSILEGRFLCEIRKAVVIGAYADVFNFDDRRRLLLTLLLLFKARPYLLSGQSNIDIFLPVYDFMNGINVGERRALAQPAILLIHAIAEHSDIADCIVSEDLVETLVSFLQLKVPKLAAGIAGTDPRICSLMLLLRLMRLSSATVDIALKSGVVSKLADFILDTEGPTGVVQRAVECLAMMCADKRKGQEVSRLLERIVPENSKKYGAWIIPTDHIRDEVVDSETIKHFLQHRYPCDWWVLDSPEGRNDPGLNPADPVAIVDASVSFPKASISDFKDEADGVFKRSVAIGADVDTKDVHILRKRAGSVIVDFEVHFHRPKQGESKTNSSQEPEVDARLFKEKLESLSTSLFGGRYFGPMGPPKVIAISVRQLYQTDCQDPVYRHDAEKDIQDTQTLGQSLQAPAEDLREADPSGSQQQPPRLLTPRLTTTGSAIPRGEPQYRPENVPESNILTELPIARISENMVSNEPPAATFKPVPCSPSGDLKASHHPTSSNSSQPEHMNVTSGQSFVPNSPVTQLSASSPSHSPVPATRAPASPSTLPVPSNADVLPSPSSTIASLSAGFPQGPTRTAPLRPPTVSMNTTVVPALYPPVSPGRLASPPPLSPRPPPHTSRGPVSPGPSAPLAPKSPSLLGSPATSPPGQRAAGSALTSVPRSSSERFPPQSAPPVSIPRSSSMRDSPPTLVDPSLLGKFNNNILVKFEDGRVKPLGEALALVLEGADLKPTKWNAAITGFCDALEEEQEEMASMIEKYPKLVQKFALQPLVAYDLMVVWEENCVDLLLNDELNTYGKTIAAVDICSVEDPDQAVAAAKKKFQAILKIRKETQAKELKEKPKLIKVEAGAESTRLVSGKKEKVQDEPRVLPKFKPQPSTKKKGVWS